MLAKKKKKISYCNKKVPFRGRYTGKYWCIHRIGQKVRKEDGYQNIVKLTRNFIQLADSDQTKPFAAFFDRYE